MRWSRKSVHPHMRGAYAQERFFRFAGVRFIPTCVGLTLKKMALLLDFDQLNAI